MEFAKEWSKKFPCLIEVGECEREDKYAGHDVNKLEIKTQPSSWKPLGYARSELDGSFMAIGDDIDNPTRLIRVTELKNGKPISVEIYDHFKTRCEALLSNAKNGLMNFYGRVGRYYSDDGKEALQEAIREVCRKATDFEQATIRQVLWEIRGDDEAMNLFWKALNDDASRN